MGVKIISQDLETIIYKMLNVSAIKDVINGGIYKEAFRPTNSGKIDICVNVLTLTQENPQIGIANINIYVQDKKQTINTVENYIPNSTLIKSITDVVIGVINNSLNNPEYGNIGFTVINQKTYPNQDNEIKEHFQNIQVKFIIT